MGAWIETFACARFLYPVVSHPMWVRGLKLPPFCLLRVRQKVAPYVGAWIETISRHVLNVLHRVAPYVGAWIETDSFGFVPRYTGSHPMWVRGLKHIL